MGIIMNLTNKDDYYFFINLLFSEDYKSISRLIHDDSFDLNTYYHKEKPILHWLNKFKSPDMIYFLASQGIDVNLKNEPNNYQKVQQTPLIVACKTYKPKMLKALLDCGANPNLGDTFEEHALFHCLIDSRGNEKHKQDVFDCIDLLLDANIDITRRSTDTGKTILDLFEFTEQFEVAKHVIDKIGSEKSKSILASSLFANSNSTLNQYIEHKAIEEEKYILENITKDNHKKSFSKKL
jgi:hypothetical protein